MTSRRGRRKKGRGRGREKSTTFSPLPPPFYPFFLSPTPFDACYAGYIMTGASHENRATLGGLCIYFTMCVKSFLLVRLTISEAVQCGVGIPCEQRPVDIPR